MTSKPRQHDTEQPRIPPLALLLLACAAPGGAFAQGWEFEPVIRVGLETDDNARLDFRTDEEIELEGFLADLLATVSYEAQLHEFEFTPRLLSRNYNDQPEFDSDDIFFNAGYDYGGQFSNFAMQVFYDEQQVRNAERADTDLDPTDPGDFPEDDTGRVGLFGERERWRFLSEWSRQLSASSLIEFDLQYANVRYDEVFVGLLTDYDDIRVGAGYQYAFSPLTTGLFHLSARAYDSKNVTPATELDGYNAQIGFDRELSNTTSLRVLVGAESTDATTGESITEPVGEILYRRRLETIRMLARYERLVNASGAGQLSVRDSVSLTATRQLSQKVSAGLGLRAHQDEPLGETTAVEEREYVQVRALFAWHMSPSFTAEFDYRYTVLDRGQLVGESGNSNQINLWLSYHPNSDPEDR